jgi:hypothetical protein
MKLRQRRLPGSRRNRAELLGKAICEALPSFECIMPREHPIGNKPLILLWENGYILIVFERKCRCHGPNSVSVATKAGALLVTGERVP